MTLILDVGLGNVGSLLNMLRHLGLETETGATADHLRRATRVLLPGVGAFDTGMARLEASGSIPLLRERVLQERLPILGICLGMQLLGRTSEEGTRPGLDLLPMRTVRFAFPAAASTRRVPHMGWNECRPIAEDSLLHAVPEPRRFYFVHSYHVVCDTPAYASGVTWHGIEFTSAVRRSNVMGVQFHPEKSHRYGMALLEHFVRNA